MSLMLEWQLATESKPIPSEKQVQKWLDVCFPDASDFSVVVRLVGSEESESLNVQYRGKKGPTNVLSFPFDVPEGVPLEHLGDLVICVPVVRCEAAEQGKSWEAHWAHMLVHGILHLHGYDHVSDTEAEEMEVLEGLTLARIGISDPYSV